MSFEWVMWVILTMAFFLMELIKPKWVVFWFAIGSIVATITSIVIPRTVLLDKLPMNVFYLDIMVFFGVSLLLVIFARPMVIPLIVPKHPTPTGVKSAIGREEICLEDIDNSCKQGAVKLYGTPWNARSYEDNVKIKAGTKVKIVDIEGLCLIVEPVGQETDETV